MSERNKAYEEPVRAVSRHIEAVNRRNEERFDAGLAAYAANPDKQKPLPPTPPLYYPQRYRPDD